MTSTLPRELTPFLAGDETTERILLVLAAPESLTDPLAQDLLRLAAGEDADPERFVGGLHLCDFVIERNSEWHLSPPVREALVERLTDRRELSDRVHGRLLDLTEPEAADAPDELPRYLHTGVGRAYHATFLSREGIRGYVPLADQPLTGQQWLAGHLATEQVRLGLIPEDAIEVTFLRGMILYRERRSQEAEVLLRKVAERDEPRHEVAVASHLVGRLDGRRPQRRKRGESLLWKSLEIGRSRNEPFHVAQVLHTLGHLVGGNPKRRGEAEEMLRESLEIERSPDDPVGIAQVLHTLGQMIGRDPKRREEAEEMLRESLEMEQSLTDPLGTAKVLHTLGHLIGEDPERREEAEEMLRESLEIGRDLNRSRHQAQVLNSLSQLPGTPLEEAEALLLESLELNRKRGDARGEQIVQGVLRRLRKGR